MHPQYGVAPSNRVLADTIALRLLQIPAGPHEGIRFQTLSKDRKWKGVSRNAVHHVRSRERRIRDI